MLRVFQWHQIAQQGAGHRGPQGIFGEDQNYQQEEWRGSVESQLL